MIDFSLAKIQHQTWNIRLRLFLKEGYGLSEAEVVSHQQCKLGQWLYAEGFPKYGAIMEMQELEKFHAELHQTISLVFELKKAGKIAQANQEFIKIYKLNDRIVELLDFIEEKMQ